MKPQDPFADADLCVKCGMCAPHCPTYGLTQDENESPRGRIALIQGWSQGSLQASPALQRHLDNCLLCRACESVCPADVPFSRLMDQVRAEVPGPQRPRVGKFAAAAARSVLAGRTVSGLFQRTLRSVRGRRLQNVLNRLPGPARMLSRLPATPRQTHRYAASAARRGTIGLFTGCTGELMQSGTIDATIRILNRLGFEVLIARGQVCCGAMDLHAGKPAAAESLARQNIDAFVGVNVDSVISIATGCAAMLREYPLHFEGSETFSSSVREICGFVDQHLTGCGLKFRPLNKRVCVHTPCSHRTVLGNTASMAALINRIPSARVHELPATTHCCGAAGTYMLEHPKTAARLRDRVIDSIRKQPADIVVTSNIGCCLHLENGLTRTGESPAVMHPIELLAAQLEPA